MLKVWPKVWGINGSEIVVQYQTRTFKKYWQWSMNHDLLNF